MNSSIVVALISSFVSLIFMYLDTKLLDNPKTKVTYLKNMVLVAVISYFIVYFMGNPKLPSLTSASPGQLGGNVSTSVVSNIDQEIMTGLPDF